MRKKDKNLRDELLQHALDIAESEGYKKINIRTLAQRADVASGTIYNYFSSKEEILLALTDDYWSTALSTMEDAIQDELFYRQLEQIYEYLCEQMLSTASELMGALGGVRQVGQQQMTAKQSQMKSIMIRCLNKDSDVQDEIWTDVFTKEKFVDFIIMNMMLSLRTRVREIDFLIEIVKRTLY